MRFLNCCLFVGLRPVLVSLWVYLFNHNTPFLVHCFTPNAGQYFQLLTANYPHVIGYIPKRTRKDNGDVSSSSKKAFGEMSFPPPQLRSHGKSFHSEESKDHPNKDSTRIISVSSGESGLKVWVREAEEGFVDEEENLEQGEVCHLALHAYASSLESLSLRSRCHPAHKDEHVDRFLCAGALVQRPLPQFEADRNDNDNNVTHEKLIGNKIMVVCDAWMADSLLEDGDGGLNLQVQGSQLILDGLYKRFLELERDDYYRMESQIYSPEDCNNYAIRAETSRRIVRTRWVFVVQCGTGIGRFTTASYRAAVLRGFVPFLPQDLSSGSDDKDCENYKYYDWDEGLYFHPSLGLERYTALSLDLVGTDHGNLIIDILKLLSASHQRHPLPFSLDGKDRPGRISDISAQRDGSIKTVDFYKSLLPSPIVNKVNRLVDLLYNDGYFSTEPDSVDGAASIHFSLMTSGSYIDISPVTKCAHGREDDELIHNPSKELETILRPILEEKLLPAAKTFMNSTTLQISDVFFRQYGMQTTKSFSDLTDFNTTSSNENEKSNIRYNIPAHFDVFSAATAVVALDDAAKFGDAGLYTLFSGDPERGNGSSHISLRRYFALDEGDTVLHSVEVQHGVEVPRYTKRTSLIVWFVDSGDSSESDSLKQKENDDYYFTEEAKIEASLLHLCAKLDDNRMNHILNFILASSLESMTTYYPEIATNSGISLLKRHAHDFYIDSMARGNSHAFCRLGSLCKNNEVTPTRIFRIISLLEERGSLYCRSDTLSPEVIWGESIAADDNDCNSLSFVEDGDGVESDTLAKILWFEAAKSGNPLAQTTLAHDILDTTETPSTNMILYASVLLGLAAQQGDADATASLSDIFRNRRFESSQYNFSSTEKETLSLLIDLC